MTNTVLKSIGADLIDGIYLVCRVLDTGIARLIGQKQDNGEIMHAKFNSRSSETHK